MEGVHCQHLWSKKKKKKFNRNRSSISRSDLITLLYNLHQYPLTPRSHRNFSGFLTGKRLKGKEYRGQTTVHHLIFSSVK